MQASFFVWAARIESCDRVDVIATMQASGSTEHRVGVVLLQNVVVLGHPAGGTTNANEGADTVLSLTLQQSQLLAVAGDKAKLTLALRSTPDVIVAQSPGEISSKDILTPPTPTPMARGKGGPIALPALGR